MHNEIKKRNNEFGVSRLLSGYTREWKSKNTNIDSEVYDFDIDGVKLKWNKSSENWIDSEGAKNLTEIAYHCTIQGFYLNYASVIIGRDLFFDNNLIQVNEKYAVHHNQRPLKSDINHENKLRTWVFNRYKILLSRGIKGTYVYIEDEKLRDYFKKVFAKNK